MSFLIGNIISCVFSGLLLGMILTGILFFIPKGLYSHYEMKSGTCVLIIIFFFFFWFHFVLLVSGFKVKNKIPTNAQIESFFQHTQIVELNGVIDGEDVRKINSMLSQQYPVIGTILKKIQIDSKKPLNLHQIVQLYHKQIHSGINKFIWRHVMWISICFFLSLFFLVKDVNNFKKRKIYRNTRRMPD